MELAKWRAGEGIRQVREELRRMRIKAKRFRVRWTTLRLAVGGRVEEKNGRQGVGVVISGGSGQG